MEVERKFLVPAQPDLAGTESDEIQQGYLAVGADGEVRLRRRGDQLTLTAKRGAGIVRDEAEIHLDRADFELLWPLTQGRRLRKRRHLIRYGDGVVELDVYEGELEGLLVAEVEFPTEEAARAFQPPDWIGEDVTGDERYLNETLATKGRPS